MDYYNVLSDTLADEIDSDEQYKLIMSPDTYERLRGDDIFLSRCLDGGVDNPEVKFVWFDNANGSPSVFPIEIDESMSLGDITTKKVDGEKTIFITI